MKVKEIQIAYRLDLFIIEQYGTYSDYYITVLSYFNPRVDFLNLIVGTKLNVPSTDEISRIKTFRGYYNLVGD